jgi:GntR family transcriptional regulator
MANDPKWRRVLEDLEQRLASGEIADRFPTDRELVEHYGVSRHTIREAVRHLRARGVIERARGRGSTVTVPQFTPPAGALYSLFREVEAQGLRQWSEVLALDERADERAAVALQLPPDTPLFHLDRIRYAGDDPLAVDTVFLAPDLGKPLLEEDFTHTALYDLLEARLGVRLTGGREIISAIVPDDDIRAVLDLDDDEACFEIRRQGDLDGRPVECRLTIVRGSRFALSSDWQATSSFTPHLSVQHRAQ